MIIMDVKVIVASRCRELITDLRNSIQVVIIMQSNTINHIYLNPFPFDIATSSLSSLYPMVPDTDSFGGFVSPSGLHDASYAHSKQRSQRLQYSSQGFVVFESLKNSIRI